LQPEKTVKTEVCNKALQLDNVTEKSSVSKEHRVEYEITMSKIIAILTLVFQFALTLIATFCIYMFFALLDSDFGIDGLFGLFIIQPIIGLVLSFLTIIVCLLVGLPIRLNKKLNHWWTRNFYISIIGTVCGLALLFTALLPNFRETVTVIINEQETIKQIPNATLSYIGWFLTAFSLLHIYSPRQLTEKIKKITSK